jgi:hypothetical protein
MKPASDPAMILPPATDNKALIASSGVPDYLVDRKDHFLD